MWTIMRDQAVMVHVSMFVMCSTSIRLFPRAPNVRSYTNWQASKGCGVVVLQATAVLYQLQVGQNFTGAQK
jgi:hypothetical protein